MRGKWRLFTSILMVPCLIMSKHTRTLLIARSKLRGHSEKECCACLTPVEFLALVEDGFIPCHENVEYIREQVKAGISVPGWRYFYLKKGFTPIGEKVFK